MTGDVVTPGVLVRVLTQEAKVSLAVAALLIGTGVEGNFPFVLLTCYFVPKYLSLPPKLTVQCFSKGETFSSIYV